MIHSFTETIVVVLSQHFGDRAQAVFEASPLLQYLNVKTRSANKGSKSRGSFANLYALYVLAEDYVKGNFHANNAGRYSKYEGARFTDLFRRQRELPFGAKLQNHALNSRLNDEFAKYFPTVEARPILRDLKEQRYWINESVLIVSVPTSKGGVDFNLALPILQIVDAYVEAKRSAFGAFLDACRQLAGLTAGDETNAVSFIKEQLQPNVDARIFEIISFAILKARYGTEVIFWGWSPDKLRKEVLILYKTGRTNANDGGIDFVMRPLGRFFQVTETVDSSKYFLDIDKVQRFPLTFVVKTNDKPADILENIRAQATQKYRIETIVRRYLEAVEEIINIPMLLEFFSAAVKQGNLATVMNEIILQSQVEFNYEIEEVDETDADVDSTV